MSAPEPALPPEDPSRPSPTLPLPPPARVSRTRALLWLQRACEIALAFCFLVRGTSFVLEPTPRRFFSLAGTVALTLGIRWYFGVRRARFYASFAVARAPGETLDDYGDRVVRTVVERQRRARDAAARDALAIAFCEARVESNAPRGRA